MLGEIQHSFSIKIPISTLGIEEILQIIQRLNAEWCMGEWGGAGAAGPQRGRPNPEEKVTRSEKGEAEVSRVRRLNGRVRSGHAVQFGCWRQQESLAGSLDTKAQPGFSGDPTTPPSTAGQQS